MSESISVTHIRQDAIIPLSIGTAMVTNLQAALNYLVEGKVETDILAMKDHLAAGTPLTPWETATLAVTQTLQAIYASAVSNNLTVVKSLEDTISGVHG